jgi:hypothetical protein
LTALKSEHSLLQEMLCIGAETGTEKYSRSRSARHHLLGPKLHSRLLSASLQAPKTISNLLNLFPNCGSAYCRRICTRSSCKHSAKIFCQNQGRYLGNGLPGSTLAPRPSGFTRRMNCSELSDASEIVKFGTCAYGTVTQDKALIGSRNCCDNRPRT